jgi:hypothetical protein
VQNKMARPVGPNSPPIFTMLDGRKKMLSSPKISTDILHVVPIKFQVEEVEWAILLGKYACLY